MRSLCVLVVGVVVMSSSAWAMGLPEPPSLRLFKDVVPLGYSVELEVDPRLETFTGTIDIEVTSKKPINVVWLHADDLTVETASVVGQPMEARIVGTKQGMVGLAFSPALAPGQVTLRAVYHGVLSSKDSAGASRQKEGDDWYVFTHFEPIDARRVFPCFDEPSFKVPWRLGITTPATMMALSNTPTTSVTELTKGGIKSKRFEFAKTKPLPSYLVAFAVGAFELVDAGKSRSGVPIRIVTPHGQAAQARWAVESTHQVLALLEDYFGTSYPYEKLDMIAVPLFSGAMENPGLITFSSQLMLRRPTEETVESKRNYASVATHELAHQWFGDLVTMAWWDDLWLNEAFASWMTPKIIERWQPGWGAAEGRVGIRGGAMATDRLLAARRIRQPIESNNDIKNAFDPITYNKGASVIHMFEEWVTPSVLQTGVRAYLKKHAHGNATSVDFLAAISKAARKDIAPPFSTFLDQAGVPVVSMEVVCTGKTPTVKLHQERYLPIGVASPGPQTWQIPVCVRGNARACTLLTTPDGQIPLSGTCPTSLLPNVGAAGYYRAALAPHLLTALLADPKSLSTAELLGVLADVNAAVRAGKLPFADALALVPRFAGHPNRHVVQAAVQLLGNARDNGFFPDALRPAWARFVQQHFGARARALGWLPRPTDDEDTRILRNLLVPLVADDGEDAILQAEATRLSSLWLKDHAAVPAEMVWAVNDSAAQRTDGAAARYDAWLAAAKTEKDRLTRNRLLNALASSRDPALVARSLTLVLADTFEIRESLTLLFGATRTPRTRRQAWDFVRTKFDPLVAKLPRDFGANLPSIATALCDDTVAVEAEVFFKDRAPRFVGGPRQLALALENTRQCAAFKRAQSKSATDFLTALR